MNYLPICLTILLLAFSSLTIAQPQWGGLQQEPEEVAAQQTRLMVDSLHLSAAQTEKVADVNGRYALRQQQLRDNSDGDFKALRESMQSLTREQDAELKKYLTADQMTTWRTIRERQRQERMQHRSRRN